MWLELNAERVRVVESDIVRELSHGISQHYPNSQFNDFSIWNAHSQSRVSLKVRGFFQSGFPATSASLAGSNAKLYCDDRQVKRLQATRKADGRFTATITDGTTSISLGQLFLDHPVLVKDSRQTADRVWLINGISDNVNTRPAYTPNSNVTADEVINPDWLGDAPSPWSTGMHWMFQPNLLPPDFSNAYDGLLQLIGLRLRSRLTLKNGVYEYGLPITTRLHTATDQFTANTMKWRGCLSGGRWRDRRELDGISVPEKLVAKLLVGPTETYSIGTFEHDVAKLTDIQVHPESTLRFFTQSQGAPSSLNVPALASSSAKAERYAEAVCRNHLDWLLSEYRIDGLGLNLALGRTLTFSGLIPWVPTGLESDLYWSLGNGQDTLGQTVVSCPLSSNNRFGRVQIENTTKQPDRNSISVKLNFQTGTRVNRVVVTRDSAPEAAYARGPFIAPTVGLFTNVPYSNLANGTYTVRIEGTVGNWSPRERTVTVTGGQNKDAVFTASA